MTGLHNLMGIEEASRSAKAIDERVIISFCDKNVAIARLSWYVMIYHDMSWFVRLCHDLSWFELIPSLWCHWWREVVCKVMICHDLTGWPLREGTGHFQKKGRTLGSPVFNPGVGDLKKACSANRTSNKRVLQSPPWTENWNFLVMPLLRTLFKLVLSPRARAMEPAIFYWSFWSMILLARNCARWMISGMTRSWFVMSGAWRPVSEASCACWMMVASAKSWFVTIRPDGHWERPRAISRKKVNFWDSSLQSMGVRWNGEIWSNHVARVCLRDAGFGRLLRNSKP